MSEVTRLLAAIQHSDARAGEDLLPIVYRELRRIATFTAKMRREQRAFETILQSGNVPFMGKFQRRVP